MSEVNQCAFAATPYPTKIIRSDRQDGKGVEDGISLTPSWHSYLLSHVDIKVLLLAYGEKFRSRQAEEIWSKLTEWIQINIFISPAELQVLPFTHHAMLSTVSAENFPACGRVLRLLHLGSTGNRAFSYCLRTLNFFFGVMGIYYFQEGQDTRKAHWVHAGAWLQPPKLLYEGLGIVAYPLTTRKYRHVVGLQTVDDHQNKISVIESSGQYLIGLATEYLLVDKLYKFKQLSL